LAHRRTGYQNAYQRIRSPSPNQLTGSYTLCQISIAGALEHAVGGRTIAIKTMIQISQEAMSRDEENDRIVIGHLLVDFLGK
jgi:hypothetical protein